MDFCKKHWDGEPAPHIVWDFISMILCNRNPENVFFNKRCVGGRMGCHLQNTRFGQMGVWGSSNWHAHFIG